MKQLILFLFILVMIASCTSRFDLLNGTAWLTGTWETKTNDGKIIESWKKLNDSTMSGYSFQLKGTDTVSSETISLLERNGKLFYIPLVNNQNNGQPISFTNTSTQENELVFENPEHDFPQKISYKKIGSDSLVAEISGMVNGTLESQSFYMKKQ